MLLWVKTGPVPANIGLNHCCVLFTTPYTERIKTFKIYKVNKKKTTKKNCDSSPSGSLIIHLLTLFSHKQCLHIKLHPRLCFFLLLLVRRRRDLNDKHAPGLLTDFAAVICMSKATCCRSETGYPVRIPGIPIPNGFRVLVGSFLMRFLSGPGFSVTRFENREAN